MSEKHDHASHSVGRFLNRREAGVELACEVRPFAGQDTLVLGIPRGGVIVAAEVARALGAELDALVSRKLGAPDQPELAIGAVTATGGLVVNDQTISAHDVTPGQLASAIASGVAGAAAHQARFRGDRPAPRLANRTVIVVDDGLATGATMRAALRDVRAAQPGRLVAAVPVGDPEACADLQAYADSVVCLCAPASFAAASSDYDDFRAPDDETVRRLLEGLPGPDQEA